MSTILSEIAAYAAKRVALSRKEISLEEIRERALALATGAFRFEETLRHPGLSLICEVKKASPSKGIISECFPYREIAREYESAGADCVSCLTEPKWFLGSDGIFREIRRDIAVPMLRKDFTVDEYQLYEAKCLGADAVLLICALLDTATLAYFLEICAELGLCALVEAHDEAEIRAAAAAGGRIIGVNNRNLKDFSVNLDNARRLRDRIPSGALFVAESGIQSADAVTSLRAAGADAVLIGEALMRAADKRTLLASFRRAAQ